MRQNLHSSFQEFKGDTVTLEMPDGVKVTDLRWISVWCKKFSVNFGDLFFDFDGQKDEEKDEGEGNEGKNGAKVSFPSLGLGMVITIVNFVFLLS